LEEQSELNAKQERALVALMTCRTLDEAADQASVGQRTLRRWLQQEAFQSAFKDLRREAMASASTYLRTLAWEAVSTLRAVMTDDANAPGSRVSAARTLLEHAQRAVEFEDLSLRVGDRNFKLRFPYRP
jgi:hypothetical protein